MPNQTMDEEYKGWPLPPSPALSPEEAGMVEELAIRHSPALADGLKMAVEWITNERDAVRNLGQLSAAHAYDRALHLIEQAFA